MIETLQQKIDALGQELKKLIQQKNEADAIADQWRDKRTTIHVKMRKLREETDLLKQKRDILNQSVRELKEQREKAKQERKEKIEQVLQLREKIAQLRIKKPSASRQALEAEIQKLDWKIQTTPMTAHEERPIIERLKQLETQLQIYKQLDSVNEKTAKLQEDADLLFVKARQNHEELATLAGQSQLLHAKRLEILEKMKALKAQADEAHQNFIHAKQPAAELSQKCSEIIAQINVLKEQQDKIEEEKRVEKEKETLSQVEEKAREKLKRGKKLTWEEFKVLAEKGL